MRTTVRSSGSVARAPAIDNRAMSAAQPSRRKNVNDLVAEAKTRIEEVSVDQLRAEIEAGDVTVVDIRDVRERWTKGAIPGAKSMPRGMLEFWFDPESPYYREGFDFGNRYVLHCAAGGRSALAAAALQDLGYTNVAHLEVGFNGWADAGGAVQEVQPDPKYYRRDD
jgi:rhodanese-related sulfurtransferase